jgi:hypothetical protein
LNCGILRSFARISNFSWSNNTFIISKIQIKYYFHFSFSLSSAVFFTVWKSE